MTDIAVTTTDPTKRLFQWATIAMFVAFMILPTFDLLLRPDEAREPTVELRKAAPAPTTPRSWLEFFDYPRKFEAHWNDTFGLRDKFLRWHSIFKVLWLGIAPNPKHSIGKDHWIFNRQNSLIENWRGVLPFKPRDLENWRQRIERRSAECTRLGAHYLFVICPDKPHIYPEYLPDNLHQRGPSRMDQLFGYLKANSPADFLDLRPCLIDEKKNDDPATGDFVYYPLGTHWQTRGGTRATNAMIDHLKQHFPNLKNVPLAAQTKDPPRQWGDTEARNMYIRDLLPQWEHWWKPANPRQKELEVSYEGQKYRITEVDDPTLPRALLFHDSFGSYLDRTIAEAFSRLEMYWSYDFDLKKIALEKPDIVIEMIVERALVFQDPMQVMPGEADGPTYDFFRSSKVLYRLDPGAPERGLAPVNRAKLSSAADATGAVAVLESFGPPDSFALVEGSFRMPNQRLLIRVVVESPRDDHFTLFYKRKEEDATWSADLALKAALIPGSNDLFLELNTGSGLEGLIVQPLDLRGTVRIESLEIREGSGL